MIVPSLSFSKTSVFYLILGHARKLFKRVKLLSLAAPEFNSAMFTEGGADLGDGIGEAAKSSSQLESFTTMQWTINH